MNRRTILQLGGAALAPFSSVAGTKPSKDRFYFGVIADTHIVDDCYRGPAGNPEDTESIRRTTERLSAARDHINSLQPSMDLMFLVGDYFHDYPSADLDFYFENTTRLDHAKALTDGFRMPVHVGFGNHDYAVPKLTREASHEMKLGERGANRRSNFSCCTQSGRRGSPSLYGSSECSTNVAASSRAPTLPTISLVVC
jgi:hypothetical protein